MTVANVIAALDLPAGAGVNQRVPKKLLVEHGAPTAADKRRINDGIEEVRWLAALKPTTIGVPEFRDTAREYLEIAVLSVALRSGAQAGRLAELIHRAVPYPVFLIASQGDVGRREKRAPRCSTVIRSPPTLGPGRMADSGKHLLMHFPWPGSLVPTCLRSTRGGWIPSWHCSPPG
jgi:hypothetical protein